jgi:NAD(P) transhydrogenase subunit alpha
VVLDMAAESGGNVEGAVPGRTVQQNGVAIVGASNLASQVAPATTVLYARNLLNFVQLLLDPKSKELKVDTSDELINGTLLTSQGAVVHAAFKPAAA